jgi:hypothetical protein
LNFFFPSPFLFFVLFWWGLPIYIYLFSKSTSRCYKPIPIVRMCTNFCSSTYLLMYIYYVLLLCFLTCRFLFFTYLSIRIYINIIIEVGSWRIRINYELNKLIENAVIVRFIKSRRIAWLGHVMRMDDKRTPVREY